MPVEIDMADLNRLTIDQRIQIESEIGYVICGDRRRMRYPTRYLPCLHRLGHIGHHTTVWPGQARAAIINDASVYLPNGSERTRLESGVREP